MFGALKRATLSCACPFMLEAPEVRMKGIVLSSFPPGSHPFAVRTERGRFSTEGEKSKVKIASL